MTKFQLIEALHEKHSDILKKSDAELIVNLFFKEMSDALSNGGRVEIRGFASFQRVKRDPRIGRNPKTGDKVKVPSKNTIFFKVGKELKERVDK